MLLSPIDFLLLCVLAAYSIEFFFLRIGITKANTVPKDDNYLPKVSIIVAARNEEQNIGDCIESLANLDYPKELLEVIIVNDHSTDQTESVILRCIEKMPFMKLLSTPPEQGNLKGKTNAVTNGIEISSGEILMFTDADCIVQPQWVKETVKYFTGEVGIVGGYTILEGTSAFEIIQALDWVVLFSTASSTAGWKIPLTAIGNNLSVKRKAYDLCGGYRTIPFSVTEDYALVQAILQKTPYKLRFPLSPNAFALSKPCETWKQLFRQKQRWGVGGLDMVARGLLIMIISWTLHLLIFTTPFFASPAIFATALAGKIIIDFFFLRHILSKLKKLRYLKYFFFFEIYFVLYVIVIPFLALFSKRVLWKERSL